MDTTTPVGAAWADYYKPGMSKKEARAFIAGFGAATPELEYAWRTDSDHYWPFSSRDDEDGCPRNEAAEAAQEDWFDAPAGAELYVRTKAMVPGEWRRA